MSSQPWSTMAIAFTGLLAIPAAKFPRRNGKLSVALWPRTVRLTMKISYTCQGIPLQRCPWSALEGGWFALPWTAAALRGCLPPPPPQEISTATAAAGGGYPPPLLLLCERLTPPTIWVLLQGAAAGHLSLLDAVLNAWCSGGGNPGQHQSQLQLQGDRCCSNRSTPPAWKGLLLLLQATTNTHAWAQARALCMDMRGFRLVYIYKCIPQGSFS